jgi:hypothetical protein
VDKAGGWLGRGDEFVPNLIKKSEGERLLGRRRHRNGDNF